MPRASVACSPASSCVMAPMTQPSPARRQTRRTAEAHPRPSRRSAAGHRVGIDQVDADRRDRNHVLEWPAAYYGDTCNGEGQPGNASAERAIGTARRWPADPLVPREPAQALAGATVPGKATTTPSLCLM